MVEVDSTFLRLRTPYYHTTVSAFCPAFYANEHGCDRRGGGGGGVDVLYGAKRCVGVSPMASQYIRLAPLPASPAFAAPAVPYARALCLHLLVHPGVRAGSSRRTIGLVMLFRLEGGWNGRSMF